MSNKHQIKSYSVRNLLLAGIAASAMIATPALAGMNGPVRGRIIVGGGVSDGKRVSSAKPTKPSKPPKRHGKRGTGSGSRKPILGRIIVGSK